MATTKPGPRCVPGRVSGDGLATVPTRGELAAVIAGSEAFDYLDAPIVRLAGRDMPIPYNRTLEYNTVPQVENIVEAARKLVQRA